MSEKESNGLKTPDEEDCIILLTNSENWTSKIIQKIKGKNKDENKNDTWENHVR